MQAALTPDHTCVLLSHGPLCHSAAAAAAASVSILVDSLFSFSSGKLMGNSCEKKNRSLVCKSPGLYLPSFIICSVIFLTFWDDLPSPPSNIVTPKPAPKHLSGVPHPSQRDGSGRQHGTTDITKPKIQHQALHARDVAELRSILGLSNRLIPAEGKGNLPNNGIFLDSETLLLLLRCFFGGHCHPEFSFWESQ